MEEDGSENGRSDNCRAISPKNSPNITQRHKRMHGNPLSMNLIQKNHLDKKIRFFHIPTNIGSLETQEELRATLKLLTSQIEKDMRTFTKTVLSKFNHFNKCNVKLVVHFE